VTDVFPSVPILSMRFPGSLIYLTRVLFALSLQCVLCVVSVFASPLADDTGVIRGIVQDNAGERLIGANVAVKGTKLGGRSDAQGRYLIPSVKGGLYTVEASFVGYTHISKTIVVRGNDTVKVDFLLEETAFAIGGMEVIGTTDLLPREADTKTTITAAEIEHFQASSIGDVLDLVPGVQKTDNPGLGKTSQIAVRGDQGDALSAFGTLVMIDGIPLSNNASLQFERYSEGATGVSNLGRGADLRMIPADNVQSIEVVSGVPSVRYGDVTSGIINVQTKIGSQPHRLKVKSNPDTREANLGGGFSLGNSGFSYNANIARSERDIRKDGDEYSRLTGQLVFNKMMLDDALTFNAKVHGQKIYDEEEPKGDAQQTHNYNRGHTLGMAFWGRYGMPPGVSEIEYNTYLTYRKENSFKSRLVQSDLRVLPNGDTVSTYIGKVETHGIEWTLGGRLEWSNTFFTGDLIHRTVMGTDLQYNANTGDGLMIDSIFNYYGSQSGRTSYSFDGIPGQLLASVYAEDRIAGNLGADFTLSLGLRYEMYRPYGFDIKGLWGAGDLVKSHQGAYLNPRMSLLVALSSENQIRLSAGYSSKSPPMSSIYPPPDVLRWRNPTTASLLYFRPDLHVPDLKGYREGQIELAYDQKLFGSIGLSASGYYRKRTDEPEQQIVPVFASANSGGKTLVYYVDYYSLYENLGWTETKGLEFSLKTSQIRPLNMDFRVVGSYSRTNSSRGGASWDDTPDASRGQFANYKVPGVSVDTLYGFMYSPYGKWSDRLLVNYYLKYTHPSLGLWVTLRAEQLVFERTQEYRLEPVDYNLLTASDRAQRDWEESIHPRYVKWLLNLNISKSLWKGAEVSFYVNNFLDDLAIGRYQTSATQAYDDERNPPLFYGIEFSIIVDELLKVGTE
jgi:hypothetical protein